MRKLLQDLRYATRSLLRTPGFSLVALLTLALGIGATTAIYSVVDGVLLRPLPFEDPDRLVRIWETTPDGGDFSASEPNFLDFRERSRSFSHLAAYRYASLSLTGGGEPERVEAVATTRSLFPLLGAEPALGRSFTAEEDRPGAGARVVVIGHALWQRRFGGDPAVLGRQIVLDGRHHTVTGVMPPGFDFPGVAAWVPLAASPHADRTDHWLDVVGRLRPGIPPRRAEAELAGIAAELGGEHPEMAGWGARLVTFPEWIVGPQFRRTALVLLAAVGFLLLLGCANLANLLLARATVRQGEMGIRAALGAGRGRLVRQLLTESLLLALLGAGIGALLAAWAVPALQALDPAGIPRLQEVRVDARVLLFALALGVLTSLVFGLAPALQSARVDLQRVLQEAGRGRVSPARRRLRDALVVAQVALAVVLLVGAGVMLRSFARLQSVDAGFDTRHTLAVPLQLPDAGYVEPWQKVVFYREVLARVEALPGVVAAGATAVNPFTEWNFVNDVTPADRAAETPPGGFLQAAWRSVTPGYFAAAGIPLVRGRTFSDADRWDGPPLVVVSRSLARRLWPGEDPVGKELFWGGTTGTPRTVIGVVGDIRDVALEAEPQPMIFVAHNQLPLPGMTLLVRAAGDPAGLAAAVRREIRAVGPALPVPVVQPLSRNRADSVAGPRLQATLLGAFAALAILLAGLGIYGVLSFSVAQRRREIGLRMALGARSVAVSRAVVGRALLLTGAGAALGLAGAVGLTRFVGSLLFEIAPTDPATFAAVPLLVMAVALAAALIPARRATRVDPAATLRAD